MISVIRLILKMSTFVDYPYITGVWGGKVQFLSGCRIMSYSVKVGTAVLLVTLAALGVVAGEQLEQEAHHRDKRGIYYNSQAPVLIGKSYTHFYRRLM
jgi:hypothetical protein